MLWQYRPSSGRPTTTRAEPEIGGRRTAIRVKPGELLRVVEERPGAGGVQFLRLQGDRGWLFDRKPGVGIVCVRHVEVWPMKRCYPAPADFRTAPEVWATIHARFAAARAEAAAEVTKVLRPMKLEVELAEERAGSR